MKNTIKNKLAEIENKHRVKILYAVESGSRAWGLPSKDSDYDVRFIYIHHPEWYLSIDPQGIGKKRDVIEEPINDLLDISGWEITKALRLFRKNNPSLLEWLRSEMVYDEKYSFVHLLRKLESEVFAQKSMIHHYLNMAENNYREFLNGTEVKIKKYFYVLRPIMACKWIIKYNEAPPVRFHTLLEKIELDKTLKIEIDRLSARKIQGAELDMELPMQAMNDFLEQEMEQIETYAKSLQVQGEDPTARLDVLFRDTLKEAWGREGQILRME